MTPFNPGPPQAPPSRGAGAILWLFALLGLGALLIGGGTIAFFFSRGFARGFTRSIAGTQEEAGAAPLASSRSRVRLPPVERHVPQHALSLLDGCSDADLDLVRGGIDGAIDVGAPLYNSGNLAGCYHLYEGTAADLERKVGASCAGPKSALESGRSRAASLATPGAQAWAMRDTFDGLIDVIARRQSSQ